MSTDDESSMNRHCLARHAVGQDVHDAALSALLASSEAHRAAILLFDFKKPSTWTEFAELGENDTGHIRSYAARAFINDQTTSPSRAVLVGEVRDGSAIRGFAAERPNS